MDDCIILEASKRNVSKSTKTYKCPYCNERFKRYDLVFHIQDKHEDMIPEGFTPARIVFNLVNKKQFGRCIICKDETKWNEQTWRYEKFCDKKSCRDKYIKNAKNNMIKKYNKPHLLNDDNQQNKMLQARKISGNYKFKDGGIRSYVGKYEKNALEFFDKVLNVPSKDIITPGPTIEYEYKGKKHFWILDQYYLPANLVIDEKDGGSNPNTREMPEYREKQKAKEKALKEQGQYNYIRLTDNNFEQLIYILAEIKQQLMDNPTDEEKIIEINESMAGGAAGNAMPQMGGSDGAYIVPCMMDNTYAGNYLATNKDLSNMYKIDNNKLTKANKDDLKHASNVVLKYKKSDWCDKIKLIDEDMKNGIEITDPDYFYKKLTGKEVISKDQILFDENFEQELNMYKESDLKKEICEATTESLIREFNEESFSLPLISNKDKIAARYFLEGTENLEIFQDLEGYYAYNNITKNRSKSYKKIEEIPFFISKLL